MTSQVVQYQGNALHYIGGVARPPDHLLLLLDAERVHADATQELEMTEMRLLVD